MKALLSGLIFTSMAYNRDNYKKHVQFVLSVYRQCKNDNTDKPDSQIVRQDFPKHGLNMSYRKWMNIKGLNPVTLNR